ncbi:MAG: EAL domain-containing protein [Oceanospirillaceae bacterium]
MKSLQNKIFLFFVLLLLLVQLIGVWTVLSGKNNQEAQEISNRLNTAKTIFSELFDSRSKYLKAFSTTASKDYGIKQVFNEDRRSLLVALNNHRKRINADLVMSITDDGIISAQLVATGEDDDRKIKRGKEADLPFQYTSWLNKSQSLEHLYKLNGELYQLSLSPIQIGSKVLGWIGFGFQIDRRLAMKYKEITGLETIFILRETKEWELIASSALNAQLSLAKNIVKGDIPQQYIAQSQLISNFDDSQLGVAMYGLRADLVEVLQEQWGKLLLLIFSTLVLSLAGAYLVAASITKPIKILVKQVKIVALGDYSQGIKLRDRSELGQLANEFNVMQNAVLSRERALQHSVNHDPLTDLPNRHMLLSDLRTISNTADCFTIFHLNLSRLKDVNDTLGHEVGDQIIKEAALRLNDTPGFKKAYHMGGDEFILISQQRDKCNISVLASSVQQQLKASFDHDCFCFQLQVRIGIALYPEHTDKVDILLKMADTALHQTRKNRQPTQVYDAEFDTNSIERLSLINDFKNAVSGDQLVLYYQPKLDFKSGVITHMEALVRWQHPSLGMIPPDDFIPVAEQTGQINDLTCWVLKTAIDQYNRWLAMGMDFNIAINISAENFRDPAFFDFVCHSLDTAGVNANKLTLEVTESAVVDDPKSAIELLKKFKNLGIFLSIDDYGTGYSSLAQLKQLPVHELKIDKSFVQRLEHDLDDQIIVRSTIELAHNMGLTVVAEGIEDQFALDWLKENGCEKAQGYFISKPKPADELSPWLKLQLGYREERVIS